jgi:hypothetical protein
LYQDRIVQSVLMQFSIHDSRFAIYDSRFAIYDSRFAIYDSPFTIYDSAITLSMTQTVRVGVLTGGGDAPGLNPAIKGLVYRGSELDQEVIGLFDGWRSLLNPLPDVLPLSREAVRRWDRDGGTNLGSSRTNPFKQVNSEGETVDRSGEVLENIEKLKLDALVICGGEDTLGVAARLAPSGVRIVGIPKTIDKHRWYRLHTRVRHGVTKHIGSN